MLINSRIVTICTKVDMDLLETLRLSDVTENCVAHRKPWHRKAPFMGLYQETAL